MNNGKIKPTFEERLKEKWNKRIKELADADYETEEAVEFGYRCIRGNEVFTTTDFGNIFSFLQDALREQREETIEEIRQILNKSLKKYKVAIRFGGNPSNQDTSNTVIKFLIDSEGKKWQAKYGYIKHNK